MESEDECDIFITQNTFTEDYMDDDNFLNDFLTAFIDVDLSNTETTKEETVAKKGEALTTESETEQALDTISPINDPYQIPKQLRDIKDDKFVERLVPYYSAVVHKAELLTPAQLAYVKHYLETIIIYRDNWTLTLFNEEHDKNILCLPVPNACNVYIHGCNNGGTQYQRYKCACASGFFGECCEIDQHDCTRNPCHHGGTCTHHSNLYRCTCPAGYSGLQCEINIDECNSNQCQHGSTCIDGVNGYRCHCQSGYNGRYCQTDINECANNPCQHFGMCTDHINRYTCTCPSGYSGLNCQININDCASNPCQHGGTCTDYINLYTCTCPAGYYGHNCQINRQWHSNPCVNGGTCSDNQVTGYTCQCTAGYTGHNCEIAPPVSTVPKVILDNERTINEGSDQEIIPCFASGIPDPIITWTALNGHLPPNAKQVIHYLYFENVTLTDEGYYICTAKSSTGMDIKVIHILVKAKPEKLDTAPLVTAPSIIHAKYYETASLVCNATGYPTPSITWKHNDIVVQSSGNTLVIPSVTNTTSGQYTCVATNDAGVSQANIQLVYEYGTVQVSPAKGQPDMDIIKVLEHGTLHYKRCHP